MLDEITKGLDIEKNPEIKQIIKDEITRVARNCVNKLLGLSMYGDQIEETKFSRKIEAKLKEAIAVKLESLSDISQYINHERVISSYKSRINNLISEKADRAAQEEVKKLIGE